MPLHVSSVLIRLLGSSFSDHTNLRLYLFLDECNDSRMIVKADIVIA